MKRNHRLAAVLMLLLSIVSPFASGCLEAVAQDRETITMPQPEKEILDSFEPSLSTATNRMGTKLFAQLLEEETDEKEIFISPTSIALALAMAYNGARGETREAMAETLGIKGVELERLNENNQALLYLLQNSDPSVKLQIATSLWMREGMQFAPGFVERNKTYYHALTNEFDFDSPEAAEIINKWVSECTEGLIEDMISPPIDPMTILFLINAIYFQGEWSESFDEEKTHEDTFYLPGGEAETVPFMFRSGELDYCEEEGFQAVRLPYGEKGTMAMYVFLSAENSGLREFINTFAGQSWDEWCNNFSQAQGNLYLPRFTLEYEKSLNEVLQTLGMEVAFDPEHADFFDMVTCEGEPRLFISEVKHKALIEVDEKGTEAAATTSVGMGLTSAPVSQFNMKVNRPFFFLVHDMDTDSILFMGTVTNPK